MRPKPPPKQQSIEWGHVPAPIGGINTINAASAMPPGDCVLLYNMIGAEYGLRTRLGSREWCTGLTGAVDDQVRSFLPFNGSAANGANDKLFACTSTGIWDVTSTSTSPSQVLAFGTTTGRAGFGVSHGMVTSAGHFLVYCDEVNGLHVYTETGTAWAAVAMGGGASEIDGVDPANLVFVTVFKGRLWFVERDTASLWYLDTGALYGTASKFALGTQLRAGGPLVGVWNWTLDGGRGIDDMLVAISTGGDVVIYRGTDPTNADDFGIKGVWYMGPPPAGRDIATNFGGDMLVMNRTGAVPLSRLVMGAGDLEKNQYSTAKIANLFNYLMETRASLNGWSMRLHPQDNALIITVPEAEGEPTNQLVMSLATKGWSRYRDLEIYSSEVYGGKLYYGTVDGRVCINDGTVDGITLADPSSYSAIEWACLTRFENLGNARNKRMQLARPKFLADSNNPAFAVKARYDYDFSELDPVTPSIPGSGSWDGGTWDSAVWGGDYTASQKMRGLEGTGTDVALAIRGSATGRTILVGIDVGFEQGGAM
jgi:hypothetical protein